MVNVRSFFDCCVPSFEFYEPETNYHATEVQTRNVDPYPIAMTLIVILCMSLQVCRRFSERRKAKRAERTIKCAYKKKLRKWLKDSLIIKELVRLFKQSATDPLKFRQAANYYIQNHGNPKSDMKKAAQQ